MPGPSSDRRSKGDDAMCDVWRISSQDFSGLVVVKLLARSRLEVEIVDYLSRVAQVEMTQLAEA